MKKDMVFEVQESAKLLEFLYREVKGLPRGKIKSCLEHRQVFVNSMVTTRFDYEINAGDTVKISAAEGSRKTHGIEIIYEDEFLVAINKPAKLLSVSTDTEKHRTAYSLLRENRRGELFVVHRLDRDTSGVLLFAKVREVCELMQDDWNARVTLREYLAICEGSFEVKKGRCDTLIAENSVHIMYSAKEGKRAITDYEVLDEQNGFSLVRVNLHTGRKNQIRVHMKELGHPVVGDKKYGSNENPIGRLGLHAARLGFIHPKTGKEVIIKASREKRFKLSRI